MPGRSDWLVDPNSRFARVVALATTAVIVLVCFIVGAPFLYRVFAADGLGGGGGLGSRSFPVTRNRPMREPVNLGERQPRPGRRPGCLPWHPAPPGRRRGSALWREGCYLLTVESGEARKGAVVRSTFDAGGIPGWRKQLGHRAWKRCPSPEDATTAFCISSDCCSLVWFWASRGWGLLKNLVRRT